jgi:hypothetical protein
MMKFSIDPNYKGICGRCLKNDAKHDVWEAIPPEEVQPVPPMLVGIMEPVVGYNISVCDECLREGE